MKRIVATNVQDIRIKGSGVFHSAVVWRWEGTAFGETYPGEDSDGDGIKTTTTINLRYPRQYYDQETGLHYNWNNAVRRIGIKGSGVFHSAVVWRWEGTAFGETYPGEDSDGDGIKTTTTINLRYPRQYYDQETGLHYNWNNAVRRIVGRQCA